MKNKSTILLIAISVIAFLVLSGCNRGNKVAASLLTVGYEHTGSETLQSKLSEINNLIGGNGESLSTDNSRHVPGKYPVPEEIEGAMRNVLIAQGEGRWFSKTEIEQLASSYVPLAEDYLKTSPYYEKERTYRFLLDYYHAINDIGQYASIRSEAYEALGREEFNCDNSYSRDDYYGRVEFDSLGRETFITTPDSEQSYNYVEDYLQPSGHYYKQSGDGGYTQDFSYTYDDEGRLSVSHAVFTDANGSISVVDYYYSYPEAGTCICDERFDNGDESQVIFTYDEYFRFLKGERYRNGVFEHGWERLYSSFIDWEWNYY